MTPKQRASIITVLMNDTLRSGKYDDRDEDSLRQLIAMAIRMAVAEERKSCLQSVRGCLVGGERADMAKHSIEQDILTRAYQETLPPEEAES